MGRLQNLTASDFSASRRSCSELNALPGEGFKRPNAGQAAIAADNQP